MDARHGKTLRRARIMVSGLIAGAVISFVSMQALARAETNAPGCTRSDVAQWHLSLLDTETPLRPDEILYKTEMFLDRCPDRPEIPQAQAIAAMAAVELGDADTAMAYFDLAGQQFTLRQKLYRTATLLALGREQDAWDARDRLVEDWLVQVAAQSGIRSAVEQHAEGRLVRLSFAQKERIDGLLQAWVALPAGPGWPASITLGNQREGVAFRPVSTLSGHAVPSVYADLYRCRTRRMLAAIQLDDISEDLETSARAALVAYLGAPDTVASGDMDETIARCFWPDRLLPTPRG